MLDDIRKAPNLRVWMDTCFNFRDKDGNAMPEELVPAELIQARNRLKPKIEKEDIFPALELIRTDKGGYRILLSTKLTVPETENHDTIREFRKYLESCQSMAMARAKFYYDSCAYENTGFPTAILGLPLYTGTDMVAACGRELLKAATDYAIHMDDTETADAEHAADPLWIPVGKRLPKPMKAVAVSWYNSNTDSFRTGNTGRLEKFTKQWQWRVNGKWVDPPANIHILAWREDLEPFIPEPAPDMETLKRLTRAIPGFSSTDNSARALSVILDREGIGIYGKYAADCDG